MYGVIIPRDTYTKICNRLILVTEISDGGGKTFATAAFGRNFLLQPSSCPCTPSGSRFRCFTCGFTAAVANLSYKVLSVTYFCVRSSHTMGLKRERISPSYGMIGRRMGCNVCNNLTLSTQNNKNLNWNLFNIVPYKRKSKYELDT